MTSTNPKAALRSRMLALRREASLVSPGAGQALASRFPDQWVSSAGVAVAGYWPLAHEIDPRPLMQRLFAGGAMLCLPVVEGDGRPLAFRAYRPGDALEKRAMGVSEPPSGHPACRPVLVLVPLLACDHQGNRLGFGKGYYDYTLAALRGSGPTLAIGLAHDCQMVANVPAQGHDEPLDGLVTDTDVYDFRG